MLELYLHVEKKGHFLYNQVRALVTIHTNTNIRDIELYQCSVKLNVSIAQEK